MFTKRGWFIGVLHGFGFFEAFFSFFENNQTNLIASLLLCVISFILFYVSSQIEEEKMDTLTYTPPGWFIGLVGGLGIVGLINNLIKFDPSNVYLSIVIISISIFSAFFLTRYEKKQSKIYQ